MKKRIACLLLALVMLVGLIPVTAIPAKAADRFYSEAGLRVIKQYEGFHKNAFESGGQYFIGYGSPSVADATITEANADKLLREKLDELAIELDAKFPNLVQKRKDALTWYSYTECRSTAWAVPGNKLYEAVVASNTSASKLVDAFCTSTFDNLPAGDTTRQAILNRRLCMASLYLTGSYNAFDAGGCSYTLFDGGHMSSFAGYKIQGYYVYEVPRITIADPTRGTDIFVGWYLGDQAITGLSSATAGRILSAKWQTGTDPVGASYTISADLIYQAHKNAGGGDEDLFVYDIPYGKKIDNLNRQITLTITAELMQGGNKWLHLSTGGWVNMGALGQAPSSTFTKVVTVTDDYVNIREQPNATSTKVGTAKRGEQLFISKYSDDAKWGYCSQGWIFLAYTDYVANTSPNTSNGVIGTVSATPGTVTGAAKVNVRSGAGVGNALVTTLAEGTAVTVYEQTTADGAPWGRIDQGWISLGYVKLQQVQKPTDGSTITAGSSAVVSSSVHLTVRSGPSTNYSKVATLAPGTSVVILRKQTVGGVTWGLIDQGWINLSYVTTSGISSSEGGSVYSVGGTVVNCSSGVNIRAAAGTTNALIGVAGVGTRVNVTEITEVNGFKWGHIERGWVCMDYIQLDSEFKKPEPTVPNVVEDEPDNVVDSFEGYPATVTTEYEVTITDETGASTTTRIDYGAALHETASAHSKSLLALKNGASIRILAWAVSGKNLYGKVTVGNKTGWVSLNDVTMDEFNAKVTASKTDLYEGPSIRSKTFHTLIQGSYVTVPQGNSNWAISDNILWGRIQNAETNSIGWIMLKDVTMFRENIKPAGITTYSGVGYLTGKINANVTVLKDQNGSPVYLEGNEVKTEDTTYTLTKDTRVNLQARSYSVYTGMEYGKVIVGSIAGWVPMSNVVLDSVVVRANANVKGFESTALAAADNASVMIASGTTITIEDRELVYVDNEINHGVIDVGLGALDDAKYYFILDNGQISYVTDATVEDPSNPLIASSVVLTGKANGGTDGAVYIREDTIDSTDPGMVNLLLKVSNGSAITVLNWKSVDGITWGKVQINKVVGWVKADEVDFDNLKGITNVDQLKVYNLMDKSSAVQLLRTNNKRISIYSIDLRGNILWGKAYVDSGNGREYLGYVDLSELNLNTPGIIGGADQTNLPVMAKGKINSVNVTCALVSREEGGQEIPGVLNLPKSTEVNLIGLRLRNNKAQWLVDLGDQDGWVDMDYVNMYTAVATIVDASAPIYDDLTLDPNKVLYTLYRDEKVTVLSFKVTDLGHPGVFKLYGEVPYGNTTGWILLMDSTTAEATSMNRVLPVYLVPGSTGSNVGSGSNTTPTNPTTPTTPVVEGTPAYIVCNTSVNVRSGAGVSNSLVTTLPNGTNVKIYEKVVEMGKEWARIDQGWVCMDYVRLGTLANVPNGGNNGNSGSVAIITTVPAGAIAVGYANEDIKIRSGSGLGYPEVATLKKNQSIAIYENKLDGGMSWGRTDNGWVCTSYLTITGIGVSGSGSMGTIARCGFTANVRYSANSNSPLMAKVMISSRIVIRETTTVGAETWVRTDLGWINMQYVVEDTTTGNTGGTVTPAPTPTPTEPTTGGDPTVSGGLGDIFYIPDNTPEDVGPGEDIGSGEDVGPGEDIGSGEDIGPGGDTDPDPDEDYGSGDWGWG